MTSLQINGVFLIIFLISRFRIAQEYQQAVVFRLGRFKNEDVVLDVAADTGEPGLTIATRLASRKVISTDLAV